MAASKNHQFILQRHAHGNQRQM
ncbi:hypothetical protein CCACVL1_03092, partial [Corchorus capsularis]